MILMELKLSAHSDKVKDLISGVLLPHCVRSSLETVPAGQEEQEAAPVCSVIEFSAHLVQIVIVLSLYVPALHSSEKVQKFEPQKYL